MDKFISGREMEGFLLEVYYRMLNQILLLSPIYVVMNKYIFNIFSTVQIDKLGQIIKAKINYQLLSLYHSDFISWKHEMILFISLNLVNLF